MMMMMICGDGYPGNGRFGTQRNSYKCLKKMLLKKTKVKEKEKVKAKEKEKAKVKAKEKIVKLLPLVPKILEL
jgi:hypothetical protein